MVGIEPSKIYTRPWLTDQLVVREVYRWLLANVQRAHLALHVRVQEELDLVGRICNIERNAGMRSKTVSTTELRCRLRFVIKQRVATTPQVAAEDSERNCVVLVYVGRRFLGLAHERKAARCIPLQEQ